MGHLSKKDETGSLKAFYNDCLSVLPDMKRRLSGVIAAREEDFLSLGAGLNDFQNDSLALSDLAKELADLTSGETMVDALDRLSTELDRMNDICELDKSRESLKELETVASIINELGGIITDFGRIVKLLSMLGISTRIESARLGSKGLGFSTLADDVEKLANNIVNYSGQIVDNSNDLKRYVDTASKLTSSIIATQKDLSESIFANLSRNIESMSGLTRESSLLSSRISEKTSDITDNISRAVLSMQFHDIIRQQVEHVEQAVGDMAEILRERGGQFESGELDEGSRETVGWVGDVLQLQCSQLANSRKRFVEAVDSLLGNLVGISEHILGIGEDIKGLMRHDAEGEASALALVDQGIVEVKNSLHEFADEGEGLGRLMQSVAETIGKMSSYVEEIEEVGAEIELIAINASIKAAHTGDEGAALGVLASAIQRLSSEARIQTDEVTRILERVSSSSEVLQVNASGYYDNSQVDDIVGGLESIIDTVRDMDSQSKAEFTRLRAKSDKLGEAIRRLTERVDFHHGVAETLDAAHDSLEPIRARAKEIVPIEGDRGRSERLRQLFERYTMEAERDVHEAAFGQAPALTETQDSGDEDIVLFDDEPGGGEPEGGAGDEDAFGDNVDLF